MCSDSDGFFMNRLEEGVLGDPVLAGNLILNPNGCRSPCQDGSSGIDMLVEAMHVWNAPGEG